MGRPGEGPDELETRSLGSRVEADVARVLDLLRSHGVRATFFVLGEVASSHPRMIAAIGAAGHEVACHGFHHVPVDLLAPGELEADLDLAIAAIEAATGTRPEGYRAPIWSLSRAPWGLEVLLTRGFTYDSSLVPVPFLGATDLPSHAVVLRRGAGSIVELPPLTGKCGPWRFPLGFGLGLRFFPSGIVKRAIAAENRAGRPAVIAFHPWELDPDPPSLRLAPALAVAHDFGIDRLRARLEFLLRDVAFGPAREALATRAPQEAAA